MNEADDIFEAFRNTSLGKVKKFTFKKKDASKVCPGDTVSSATTKFSETPIIVENQNGNLASKTVVANSPKKSPKSSENASKAGVDVNKYKNGTRKLSCKLTHLFDDDSEDDELLNSSVLQNLQKTPIKQSVSDVHRTPNKSADKNSERNCINKTVSRFFHPCGVNNVQQSQQNPAVNTSLGTSSKTKKFVFNKSKLRLKKDTNQTTITSFYNKNEGAATSINHNHSKANTPVPENSNSAANDMHDTVLFEMEQLFANTSAKNPSKVDKKCKDENIINHSSNELGHNNKMSENMGSLLTSFISLDSSSSSSPHFSNTISDEKHGDPVDDLSFFASTSPVIKPKKFVFKSKKPKKMCSDQDILSTPATIATNFPEVQNICNTQPDTGKKSIYKLPSEDVIDISSSSCDTPIKNKYPERESNKPQVNTDRFNTFQAELGDYMDDFEFEMKFGSSSQSQVTTETKTSHQAQPSDSEAFALANVNWDEKFEAEIDRPALPDVSKEVSAINWEEDVFGSEAGSSNNSSNSFVSGRKDSSVLFRKSYPHTEAMYESLQERFGLHSFRPHQKEIINASLLQHDCFVLMPTGGGKSLCYQLPAILMPGVTIVISPLTALISDQVDKLNALDIPAAHLCANVDKDESAVIFQRLSLREPDIKLLYLTPEKISASQLVKDMLGTLYQRGKLARFVIDEAHCLSQWGHDFRPDYKQLSNLRRNYRTVPIICLTATATKQVEADVINILGLKDVKTFIRSFNRSNIKYSVIQKCGKSAIDDIAKVIIGKFYKKSGIIYCLSRDDCEKLAMDLCRMGIKAKAYHAGMNANVREKQQRAWMQDQFHVIVATIAFGMGIDKPDVRFVIHHSLPKSVEAFYQESGRAGRDGETSYSYLYYSYQDVIRLQRIIRLDRKKNTKALEGHMENLQQMVAFCENVVDCRRYLQLIHLGETFDRKICIANKETTCDNCENINNYKTVDVSKEAKELCTIVNDLGINGNVTLINVADIYKGSRLKKLLERGYNNHKYFSSGARLDRAEIQRILKELVTKKVLMNFSTFTGEFPVVYLKPGPLFTLNPGEMVISTHAQANKDTASRSKINQMIDMELPELLIAQSSSKAAAATKLQVGKLKVTCHEELLEECRRLALERNMTLSSIMNLSAIKTMSDVLPATKEECLKIQHVTKANYEKYGEFFLKITQKFRKQVDDLQKAATKSRPTFGGHSSFEDDHYISSQERGVKRKTRGASTAGGKRRKKTFRRKKTKKWSPKKGKAGPSRSPKKGGGGGPSRRGGGSGLGLMPLLHVK